MIHLSPETLALAQRLAAAQGLSIEDAVKQAVEQSARAAGLAAAPMPPRDLSDRAVAARKARMSTLANEIAALPILDPRTPREIMDDVNAV
jgi:antitoxin VapB